MIQINVQIHMILKKSKININKPMKKIINNIKNHYSQVTLKINIKDITLIK